MTVYLGKQVTDMTAARYGWPDVYGEIIEVDGSNVKVRYESGNERWKALWHLYIREEEED